MLKIVFCLELKSLSRVGRGYKAKDAKFNGYKCILYDTPSLGEVSQGGFSATEKPLTENPPLIKKEYINKDTLVASNEDNDEIAPTKSQERGGGN
jgi:hypothetical protein